ncbi:partial 2-amino-4-hydroxy-6-hydroxymethyldihydropteridine diphosphokinase, partial [Rhodocyclaceae bacterium]
MRKPLAQTDCFIALGSNLGDRHAHILAALGALAQLPGTNMQRVSTILETEPVGPAGQERYLNGVAHICTSLEP